MAFRLDSRAGGSSYGTGLPPADYGHLQDCPDATDGNATIRLWRSAGMIYFCSQKNRRALVLQSPDLNGIDYLEVAGDSVCGNRLSVTFLKDARALALTPDNLAITGGEP